MGGGVEGTRIQETVWRQKHGSGYERSEVRGHVPTSVGRTNGRFRQIQRGTGRYDDNQEPLGDRRRLQLQRGGHQRTEQRHSRREVRAGQDEYCRSGPDRVVPRQPVSVGELVLPTQEAGTS